MKKYIISFVEKTETLYITRYNPDTLILEQTSKTYSAGVIEFNSLERADLIASKLVGYNKKPLNDIKVIPVSC